MPGKDRATVWHGKQKRFAKVEGGMPADCEPECTGAAECQREEQGDGNDTYFAEGTFARIMGMQVAEEAGQKPTLCARV